MQPDTDGGVNDREMYLSIFADVEMFVWVLSLGKFEAENTEKQSTHFIRCLDQSLES
jgi:hypothetical protein